MGDVKYVFNFIFGFILIGQERGKSDCGGNNEPQLIQTVALLDEDTTSVYGANALPLELLGHS